MKKGTIYALSLVVGVFAGCAAMEGPADVKAMRATDTAAADPAFDAKAYVGKKPGAQEKIARTFKEQPPLIPHAMPNFDEITLEDNQCMSCHGPDQYQKKQSPRVGDKHLTAGKQLAMNRYQCTMCHVPQVDAKPLVDNTFRGNL